MMVALKNYVFHRYNGNNFQLMCIDQEYNIEMRMTDLHYVELYQNNLLHNLNFSNYY